MQNLGAVLGKTAGKNTVLQCGLGDLTKKNKGLASRFPKSNKRHVVVVVFIVSG